MCDDLKAGPAIKSSQPVSEGMGHGGTRWFDLRDMETGTVRRIYLWCPKGDMPENGWPVLFLVDGNAVIATAVDAMRAQAPYPSGTGLEWGALVAIGYPTDEAYDPLQRSWDLSPPPGRTYPPFWDGTPEARTGGSAELSQFICEDVFAFLATQIRLDPSRRGLFGHSFGGLFALWMLFNRQDAFTHWIAASPSITWEDSSLLTSRNTFTPSGQASTVHLSAGQWEGDELAPFQRDAADADTRLASKARDRTFSASQEMANYLDRLPGFSVTLQTYPGETHMSVLPVAVNRALHCLFGVRSL